MNAFRGGFLQKAQSAFASTTAFYLAQKAQGYVHTFKWDTYGAQRLGPGSTVTMQDGECPLLNTAIGMVLGRSPSPGEGALLRICLPAFGNKPISVCGPPASSPVKQDSSLCLSRRELMRRIRIGRGVLQISQKESSRQTHRVLLSQICIVHHVLHMGEGFSVRGEAEMGSQL